MTKTDIALQPLVYNGAVIRDRSEMLSLTDMWKAAGSPENRDPKYWRRQDASVAFVDALALAENVTVDHLFRIGRGRGAGTFAHWQVGLAYAKYLSPEFHMWCNEVVRERMEGRQPTQVLVLDEAAKTAIGGIIKRCTGVVVKEAMELLLPQMLEDRLSSDPRFVATTFKPALDVLVEKSVPARRRRAFSQKVSSRLRRYSTSHGHPMRISRETGRYLFHVDAIGGWLAEEGQSLISRHVTDILGQGVLPFRKGGK